MKITKDIVLMSRYEVINAYNYYWKNDSQPIDTDSIRDFFKTCNEMEYSEFAQKVNDEYGVLLSNFRQSKKLKSINTIKGIMVFLLVMYLLGIIVGAIILLA